MKLGIHPLVCAGFRIVLGLSPCIFAGPLFAISTDIVYGEDNLNPDPDSLLGLYLKESGASTIARKFAIGANEGPARLVVAVSPVSFPILAKYFSGKEFLHFFHEPLTHMVQASFDGKRGSMGRLVDEFRFTQSGVDLLPIVLNTAESERVELFLDLAANTKRRYDVANFPWLLKTFAGEPYTEPGNIRSLSEWFARLPLGIGFDFSRIHDPYNTGGLSEKAMQVVEQVWSYPFSHSSLIETLALHPYDAKRGFSTPGLIAISLLATASVERLPVFFRFVGDHKQPLDPNFNLWIDLDFDPDKE